MLNSNDVNVLMVFPVGPVILVETVKVTLGKVLVVYDVLCYTLYIIT